MKKKKMYLLFILLVFSIKSYGMVPKNVTANTTNIDFGNIAISNSDTITITLESNFSGLTVDPISNPSDVFAITNDNCSNYMFTSNGDTCTFKIKFSPTEEITSTVSSFDITVPSSTTYPTLNITGVGINNAPEKVELSYPTNQQDKVNTDLNLIWKKTTDNNNDNINYYVNYCDNSSFNNCADHEYTAVYAASAGIFSLILGLIFFIFGYKNKSFSACFILVIISSVLYISSCGSGNTIVSADPSKNELEYKVENLNSQTTYYWKVIAVDERGSESESDSWSFTTK